MTALIEPGITFKENLQQMPSIDHLARVDLMDSAGRVIASIVNEAGKKGSLAVYQYLAQHFNTLDAKAAGYGLLVFAEHTTDAQLRPGAHPNIDRLLEIVAGGSPLTIHVVAADL